MSILDLTSYTGVQVCLPTIDWLANARDTTQSIHSHIVLLLVQDYRA